MKRTIPLLLTAAGGFVLIVAFFIPAMQWMGEFAAITFDILAAIAFILGGGNLLKIHLKKISDQAKGWGYSAVTLIAFLAMLAFGLFKIGSTPSANQEHYGEVFARLEVEHFPKSQFARVDGTLPEKASGKEPAASVRELISLEKGQLVFRGWMTPNQKNDLLQYENTLEWRCAIERLANEAKPPEVLAGKVAYYADHSALSYKAAMTDEEKEALLKLGEDDNEEWTTAVESLYKASNAEHSISLAALPDGVSQDDLGKNVTFDKAAGKLTVKGPLSPARRDEMAKKPFPLSRPLDGARREAYLKELEAAGGRLNEAQRTAFDKIFDGSWSVETLVAALDAAGKVIAVDKTACELLAEKQAGAEILKPKKRPGEEVSLNEAQKQVIAEFAGDEETSVEQLISQLKEAGPWEDRQTTALTAFFSRVPTRGQRGARLAVQLLQDGELTEEQRALLTAEYARQQEWRKTLGDLFLAAHTVKYRWSGEYRETGSPFWWLYEYAFKPLTATMFAMLAFYVASAAFRAFRAKNLEASLLLGTAFIILLGRTFAGVMLTNWIPEDSPVSGLRIEEMTMHIMTVFNTAGNRAIMIGIALGIASTSLKVLLGVDRSYLGSSDD